MLEQDQAWSEQMLVTGTDLCWGCEVIGFREGTSRAHSLNVEHLEFSSWNETVCSPLYHRPLTVISTSD